MKRWVVTGPTGAGKSAFTACLAARGAAVVDADRLGHEVLLRPEVVRAVAREFGPEVIAGGVVDRTRLGGLVFADPAALARLNALTHGPLSELAARRLDQLEGQGKHALAVLEAAVYFLFPTPPRADLVILVTAGEAVRRRRLLQRGLSAAAAAARIDGQRPLEPLWQQADQRVDNEGTLADLQTAADRLLARLAGIAPAGVRPQRKADQ